MPFHGEAPVGLLDVFLGGVPVQSEHFGVVALRHAPSIQKRATCAARCSLARAARAPPVFLSLTSVNSASTTLLSSFLPASPGAAPCPCWPPASLWVAASVL